MAEQKTISPDAPGKRLGIGVSAPIIDVRSCSIPACCDVITAVRMASPSAAALRCATLLNALAAPTLFVGTAATPPVITGIIARPIPPARSASSAAISPLLMSSVIPCRAYVPMATTVSPITAGHRGPILS